MLSSDDPVRVFQDFATLDLLSGGRAEIMAGRGSFIESFPLFGYDLDDYDELFAEKLELLLALIAEERVTWSGRHRAPLDGLGVYPRPLQERLPVWIAVGGTPKSVVRAALLGLPLAVAIIGGEPARFAPLVDLYREAAREGGHDPAALPVSINSHTYVAETSQQAADEFFPAYAAMMTRIGRERGWPPMTRAQYEHGRAPRGAPPDRLAAGGCGEDPRPARAVRPRPLPRPDEPRHAPARARDALDRAARHRGRAARARRSSSAARPPRRETGPRADEPVGRSAQLGVLGPSWALRIVLPYGACLNGRSSSCSRSPSAAAAPATASAAPTVTVTGDDGNPAPLNAAGPSASATWT